MVSVDGKVTGWHLLPCSLNTSVDSSEVHIFKRFTSMYILKIYRNGGSNYRECVKKVGEGGYNMLTEEGAV